MTTSYFFAILPDRDACDLTVAAAALMKAALQLRGQPVPGSRLHLTCHFFGRFPARSADAEALALAAGDRLDVPPFRIVLDHATSLGSDEPAPCVFTASSVPHVLTALHDRLHAELGAASSPSQATARRAFIPHVTWLYSVDRIHGAMPVTPIAWDARSIVLASRADGAGRYRILREWELR